MTIPDHKWLQVKINVCNACLIEDSIVYELPVDKLEEIKQFIKSYNSNVLKDGE